MLSKVWNFIFHQYEVLLMPQIERYWPQVEPYYGLMKSLLLHGTVAFIVASFCLYISAFLFGAVYYYNMPTIYHTHELDFHYNRKCIQQHRSYLKTGAGSAFMYKEKCYPTAVVDFDSPGTIKVLRPEQPYRVYLSLELPESDTNLEIGMFMAKMTIGKKSVSQPASLRFRLLVLRYAYMAMLWPLFVFDFMQAKQTLDIPFFEKIRFANPSPEDIKVCQAKLVGIANAWGEEIFCSHRHALVEIDYPDIEIYSARLHITATFSGLQRFLFQWPVFSFLVGTAIFFVPVLASVLVVMYLILCKPFWMNSVANGDVPEEIRGVEEGEGNADNNVLLEVPIEPEEPCDQDEGDGSASSAPSTPSIEMIGSPSGSTSDATIPTDTNLLPKDDDDKSDDEEGSSLRKRK